MNKIAIAVAIVVIGISGCSKKSNDETGKAVANTALELSPVDMNQLSDITEQLERVCEGDNNKYGLSNEQCIQRLHERKDACVKQTAQLYPGQISNVDRLEKVMSSHVDCLLKS